MRNEISISVYDISEYISDGYETIAIYRADTPDSIFSEITDISTRIVLVSGQEYYNFIDPTGHINDVYKFKYVKDDLSESDFITTYFYAGTSDLTEKLRYMLEDISTPHRYNIKELRRFIHLSLIRLQGTTYRKRFRSDFDGIITPLMDRQDEAIILLQALILVNQSQLTRAADTNMSFGDGRGRINVRTADTLKTNIKDWKIELNMMIRDMNRLYISPEVANMLITSPYYTQYTGGC